MSITLEDALLSSDEEDYSHPLKQSSAQEASSTQSGSEPEPAKPPSAVPAAPDQ